MKFGFHPGNAFSSGTLMVKRQKDLTALSKVFEQSTCKQKILWIDSGHYFT